MQQIKRVVLVLTTPIRGMNSRRAGLVTYSACADWRRALGASEKRVPEYGLAVIGRVALELSTDIEEIIDLVSRIEVGAVSWSGSLLSPISAISRQEAKMLNFGMPGGVRGHMIGRFAVQPPDVVNCRCVVLRPWQESLLEVFAVRGCDFGARYA